MAFLSSSDGMASAGLRTFSVHNQRGWGKHIGPQVIREAADTEVRIRSVVRIKGFAMAKIDANVAMQIADKIRPAQQFQDRAQQAQQAQVRISKDGTASPVRADDVRAAAAQLKQVVESASSRRLAFELDDDSGALYVEIRDLETGDVIKQIPSEEVLRLREQLHEMVGALINEEA